MAIVVYNTNEERSYMMFYQIVLNFSIIFTCTVLIYWPFIHYFNYTNRWNKFLFLKPVIIGLAFGLVCSLMPYFTLSFYNGLILSARIVPLLFCGLLGGPVALLIAAFLMTASRILCFETTTVGIVMSVNFSLLALTVFFVSQKTPINFRNIKTYIHFVLIEVSIVLLFVYNFSINALQASFAFLIFSYTSFFAILLVLKQSQYASERVKQTHALSHIDYLTQLPNNYAIDAHLKKLTLENVPFSYLHIDIDQFKHYNFQHSYHVGDQILAELASVLKKYSKESSAFVGRIGGEEYCCIIKNCPPALAVYEADNIRQKIEEHSFLLHKNLHVTVSIGVSTYPENGPLLDNIYQNANRALHSISEGKSNKICHYNQYLKESMYF